MLSQLQSTLLVKVQKLYFSLLGMSVLFIDDFFAVVDPNDHAEMGLLQLFYLLFEGFQSR